MHPQHEQVRQRYKGACGYCGATEVSTGGELTVEHFRPLYAGGDDSFDNLVYACFRCNLVKSTYWAPEGTEQALLHPFFDDLSEHLKLDARSGVVVALTPRGRVQIEKLHLNRPALIARRIEEISTRLLETEVADLRREKLLLAKTITNLEQVRHSLGWMIELQSFGPDDDEGTAK